MEPIPKGVTSPSNFNDNFVIYDTSNNILQYSNLNNQAGTIKYIFYFNLQIILNLNIESVSFNKT